MTPTSCATRSLCEWLKLTLVTLLTLALLISRSPHLTLSSFHALQELKDDLLDDTAWPVVMQLLNEDHWRSSKQIFIFGLIFEFNMAEARLELVGST